MSTAASHEQARPFHVKAATLFKTMNIPTLLCLVATAAITHAALTDEQRRVPLEADTADPKLAKIVLLAGSVSNKPGQHEYFAGCALLANCLKQTPGVWPVMAAEGW